MGSVFNQILAASWAAILSLPARLGASAVAVFGTACVVGVFISVLSMAAGFEKTLVGAGSDSTMIVMRNGATSELNSGISNEQAQLIADAPGVRHDEAGRPVAAAELYVIVDIPTREGGNSSANVPLRGVQAHSYTVRDNLRIVEGRAFHEGQDELIVGRAAQSKFAGLNVGDAIKIGQNEWRIVGAFEAGGSVSESELWCDAPILQQAYRRGSSFQSVRVKVDGTAALDSFKKALASDPRLNVDLQSEKDYYATQSEGMTAFIKWVGYPLAILMAFGAVFGALNTMYASVSARTREIATLRALGFGSSSVICSTLVESLLLAFVGGLIGSVVVYFVFNGYTVSTMNGASFSQVVFAFAVTPELLVLGIYAVVLIGVLGGLFPAIRAVRVPIVVALRES
ncbi:MAG TPA: FtsX-like permease family protein [Gammaproteobacteria bacterium]|nr:FtsX-like permease family protein [Gammaproteobacteria bacterium]